MSSKSTKRKSAPGRLLHRRGKLLIVLASLVVLAGAGWGLWHHWEQKSSIPLNGNPAKPTKPYINLSPPTSQDKQDTQNLKQALTNNDNPPASTNADGKKTVTVVVTSATPSTISGYVTGVFEDGGVCTAKLTNSVSGQTMSLTSQGFENASYTSCSPIHPSISGNNWSVSLSYSSATAEGTASPTGVK